MTTRKNTSRSKSKRPSKRSGSKSRTQLLREKGKGNLKSTVQPGRIGVIPDQMDVDATIEALRAEGTTVIVLDARGKSEAELEAEALRKIAECGDPDPVVVVRER